MNVKYIGRGQTAVMLSLFGVLYCVLAAAYKPIEQMLADTVSSVILLGIMLIPLAVLTAGGSGSVTERCVSDLGFFGRIINAVYFIYFAAAASEILRRYGIYASERYFSEGGAAVCIVLIGAVCAYISQTGAETVCRMSTVLMALLLLTSAVFALGAAKSVDGTVLGSGRLSPISLSGGFGEFFSFGAAGCACLCVMCKGLGKRTRGGAYGGAAAMLGAAAIIIFAVSVTVGDYITAAEYPLTDAVIYASRQSTFRNDGMFFTLWTVICTAAVSLLCACGGNALRCTIPAVKGEGALSAAAAVICAFTGVMAKVNIGAPIFNSPWLAVILTAAVPLGIIICERTAKKGVRV